MVKEINEAEFEELLSSGRTFVCDFWASWCGPCRMLAPVMEEVSKSFPNAEFVKVNVDENENLAARYNVMSIPYVAVFEGGKLTAQNVGFMPEEEMKDFLSANI